MTEKQTQYGRLLVGSKEELFARAVKLVAEQFDRGKSNDFSWAFTGGSTPAEWYRWCTSNRTIPSSVLASAKFTVSDERHVPLASDQSNFGNLDRLLLTPLQVAPAQKRPWPVEKSAPEAACEYAVRWSQEFGPGKAYDVCFLGMGDDAHTASWFPESPMLEGDEGKIFSALDVPGKGWRLTITPTGLRACGLVVVMTLGAGKAAALRRVMQDPYGPAKAPSQILKTCAEKVVWLVDPAAASEL
jgi:6-phosphogluconolactonase